MYVINDAHPRGVTSVAITSNCRYVISGGGEGMVNTAILFFFFKILLIYFFNLRFEYGK